MLYLPSEGCKKSIMIKEKRCMCLVDLENTFDRVQRKVLEWAMRKTGTPEILVRSVKSLYEGAKTRVKVSRQGSLRSK